MSSWASSPTPFSASTQVVSGALAQFILGQTASTYFKFSPIFAISSNQSLIWQNLLWSMGIPQRCTSHQTFFFRLQKTEDCFSFTKSKKRYYSGFDVECGDERLNSFGYNCGCELGIDSLHKFRILFLLISQSVGVNIDILLFSMLKNLILGDFEQIFFSLFLNAGEDIGGSGFFAFAEDDCVDGFAFRK